MIGRDGFAGFLASRKRVFVAPARLDAADQAWFDIQTLVGQNRSGTGHLQWRGGHETLTDPGNDRVTGNPFRLAIFALPFLRGIKPGLLACDIESGYVAQTKSPVHEVMQTLNAKTVCQAVEVHIAGLDDGQAHVGGAMTGVRPVAIFVGGTRQTEIARTGDATCRRQIEELKSRQRLEGFDCRARRVGAASRPIIKGSGFIVLQRRVFFRADTLDERVGIVAGLAGQGEDFTIPRVDGHHRTMILTQGVHGGFLQADIQRQVQIGSVDGLGRSQLPDHPPLDVGLIFLMTGLAMKHRLIAFFQPIFAHEEGTSVLSRVQAGQLLVVDASNVADHMGRQIAVGIISHHAGSNFGTHQPGQPDRNPGNLLLSQAQTNRYTLEPFAFCLERLKLFQIGFRQVQHGLQLAEQAGKVLDQFGSHIKAVGDKIIRQHLAISIENHAAIRRNRRNLDLVLAGQAGVLVVSCDLKVNQPKHQCCDSQQHRQHTDYDAIEK